MNRTTGVLKPGDRFREQWITIPFSETLVPNASLANNFRVLLTGDTTLQAPIVPSSGQKVLIRLEQDTTGSRVVTLGSGWASRGSIILGTGASTVSYVEGYYDDEAQIWDARGVPNLSSLYDAAGLAATAQSNSTAYTDAAISGLSAIYQIKLVAGASITDVAGGVVVDVEARAAVNAILNRLRSSNSGPIISS